MNLSEFMNIPVGMSIKEYESLLEERNKLEKQIRKASNKIYDEEDSLQVLADEVGSDRYNKHLENKQKWETKRDKALNRFNQISKLILIGGIN